MKELGGKTGVLVGLDLFSEGRGTEAGIPPPHRGNCLESEEKHLRLRVKQLICGSLNGMRYRVFDTALHTLDRDIGPVEGTVAGSWSLGIVVQSQDECCC